MFYLNGIFLSKNNINYFEIFTLITISAFAYVINQITDIETDKINNKILILPQNKISIKLALKFSIFLFILSIFLSILSEKKFYFFTLIILSMLYSLKPFSFKDKAFLDLLTNAIGYGFVVFSIGYGSISKESLIFTLIMACAYIMTAILDYEGDKKVNKNTTVVYLGIYTSQIMSIIGLLIVFFISQYTYIKMSAFISLVFLALNEIKLALAIASFILLIYPSINGYIEILIICIVLFLISELYYRLVFKRSHFSL
ncbi:MAG: UbiA family prenyltransferase [candidate division WOR-3 bacterium]